MKNKTKEMFNFTSNGAGKEFKENLSGFIDRNIKVRDDILAWVMYDFDDDKLMLETLNEHSLLDSLAVYEGEKMFLSTSDDGLKVTLDNGFGVFNPVIKEIHKSKEVNYAKALDNGDNATFEFVKSLPMLEMIK